MFKEKTGVNLKDFLNVENVYLYQKKGLIEAIFKNDEIENIAPSYRGMAVCDALVGKLLS